MERVAGLFGSAFFVRISSENTDFGVRTIKKQKKNDFVYVKVCGLFVIIYRRSLV